MKPLRIALVVLAACVISWGMFQTLRPDLELATLMPQGALLYVEAKDFGGILHDWNTSAEKQAWLKSDTLSIFARSRLYGRLKAAQDQFSEVAGLSPDMNLLGDSSGTETAFAWYDIGKLEFLFVSHVPSSRSMQSALWQSRAQFETRKSGESDFYVKTNPETKRVVAFAVVGDYLVIGTKEDLVAAAVQLISGKKDRSLRDEGWYAKAVSAAGKPGDLRMVMNLTKIVPSSYFRTYWIQQNITDMKQYSAAVTDLHREAAEYREERVLIRNTETTNLWTAASPESSKNVAEIAKLVPDDAGFYRATAAPKPEVVLETLLVKILAPHLGAAPADKLAPRVSLGNGQTGSESDLETRIDQPPSARTATENSTAALDNLLKSNKATSMLVVHSTDRTADGTFVNIRSCIVVRGAIDWNQDEVREAIRASVRPGITASDLGVNWESRQEGSVKFEQFDGLASIAIAVQGKLLVLANNAQDVVSVLRRVNTPAKDSPESYVAGLQFEQERPAYLRLVGFLDRKVEEEAVPRPESEPDFFSGNIASLLGMFSGIKSEKIVERDNAEKVNQTVTYEWSH
jgi:hypothetical protein